MWFLVSTAQTAWAGDGEWVRGFKFWYSFTSIFTMFVKCSYYKQAFYKTKALVASVFSKYCEYRCRLVSQFENSGVSAWPRNTITLELIGLNLHQFSGRVKAGHFTHYTLTWKSETLRSCTTSRRPAPRPRIHWALAAVRTIISENMKRSEEIEQTSATPGSILCSVT